MTTPSADPDALRRFDDLTFDGFRALAVDSSLSPSERIGFPDAYREGAEEEILADVLAKLPQLEEEGRRFLDIGPGCGKLALLLLGHCERHRHDVVLVDSPEMLGQLPRAAGVTKLAGRFPDVSPEGPFDAILAYSVLHYVVADGGVRAFLDAALSLLAPGGRLLIGDVPNVSKRARFFSSAAGADFHRRFMGTDDPPPRALTHPEPGGIDDAAVLAVVEQARAAGYDAYVLPQRHTLPLANRREDVLVARA